MEQLRAIWSGPRPRPNRRRRTSVIFRIDNLFWDTQFPPLPVETTGARCCPAPTAQIKLFLEIHSGHVNNDSGPGSRFYSFHPGIVIHIVPESLFTWPRNPPSTY